MLDKGVDQGLDPLPEQHGDGQRRGQQPRDSRLPGDSEALKAAGKLDNFKVDAGPEGIGIDTDKNDPVPGSSSLIESRGDVVGMFARNSVVTPAIVKAVAQTKRTTRSAPTASTSVRHNRRPQKR